MATPTTSCPPGYDAHAAMQTGLAERLASPALIVPTIDDRFEALIQCYAREIGARAVAGDLPSMERAQRFHRQLAQVRDHWRSGNDSPVRAPRRAVAVPVEVVAVPADVVAYS